MPVLTKDKFAKDFKKLMIDCNQSQASLAAMLGKSKGTLSPQINGATFRYIDLVNILDMLGYDVVWIKRHNAENKNDWGAEKPSEEKA